MDNGPVKHPVAEVSHRTFTHYSLSVFSLVVYSIVSVIDCGSLEPPDFGTIELTGTTFGSFATYSCQQGYVLIGSPTRVCQANGEWSGSAPICESMSIMYACLNKGFWCITYTCSNTPLFPCSPVIDCGSLTPPRFGSVELTGTIFGSTATYSCQQGYTLIGDATRNCQANGQWSGFPPFCRGRLCFLGDRQWVKLDQNSYGHT